MTTSNMLAAAGECTQPSGKKQHNMSTKLTNNVNRGINSPLGLHANVTAVVRHVHVLGERELLCKKVTPHARTVKSTPSLVRVLRCIWHPARYRVRVRA